MPPADLAARAEGVARGASSRSLFSPRPLRPLGPDAATDLALYRRWLAVRESWRLTVWPAPPPGPEIELLVVVDEGTPGALVEATLRSVRAQTCPRWHLSVTVVGILAPAVDRVVADALGSLPPERATLRTQVAGTPRAEVLANALEESSSPAFAFVDPGDELVADAVAQLGAALIDADVAYGDEDRVEDGLPCAPVLKPDWSPELTLTWPYLGRPVALRVAPAVAAGGVRSLRRGDWEHDLLLRVTERTSHVTHVAQVLCHRHATPAPPDGPEAVVAALARRGEDADVEPGPLPGTWRVRRRPAGTPRVSVIVPFRDSPRLLRACADSLLATASGVELELLLVDNGSVEPETTTLLERLSARPEARVLRDDGPFNWARINNAAARGARGEVLLFVNDDIEARHDGWLALLAAQALRPEVGAVGARLVYPGGAVQHAGVVVGMTGVAGHVLAGLPGDRPGYLGMAVLTRDVSAVTGACMATRREVFERLGGFDEDLWLDCNDLDYCLRARDRGLRVVYEAGAELVHHESPSRGTSASDATASAFVDRWRAFFEHGDPFLNANLARSSVAAGLYDPGPSADDPHDRSRADDADAGTGERAGSSTGERAGRRASRRIRAHRGTHAGTGRGTASADLGGVPT